MVRTRQRSTTRASAQAEDPAVPPVKAKASPAKKVKTEKKALPPTQSKVVNGRRMLFSLRDDDELLPATLICRPSKRNKSPYVGDIELNHSAPVKSGKQLPHPLVHLPNLDMGGKCRPNAQLLVKPSRDRKGIKISASATGKFGTPKCQYSCQLLYVDESEDGLVEDTQAVPASSSQTRSKPTLYPPVWVGAHPSLGERIAEVWLREGLIDGIPPVTKLERQITHPGGADMRADFLAVHADHTRRIVEIKTVVDTDYAASHLPGHDLKCLFTSTQTPYQRTAIFPWGSSNQKGPDGEKVVSARAIHHVDELARLADGNLREKNPQDGWDGTYLATLLFVVIRGDAAAFRPNHEACPSFAKHLAEARQRGVQVLAKRVSWGIQEEEYGNCYDDVMLPVQW